MATCVFFTFLLESLGEDISRLVAPESSWAFLLGFRIRIFGWSVDTFSGSAPRLLLSSYVSFRRRALTSIHERALFLFMASSISFRAS